jgi:cell division protease FtsH
MAAGYTLKTPIEERRLKTRDEFVAEMAMLLGGLAAEKLVFGQATTGSSNDLRQASDMARKMVKEFGMSTLGPIVFGEREEMAFLGREFGDIRNYSEVVAAKIDEEVASLIEESEKIATRILTQKRKTLDRIAERLIEKETIEKEEFEKLAGVKSEEDKI